MHQEWLYLAECEAIGTITEEELKRLEKLSDIRASALTPESEIKHYKAVMRRTKKLLDELDALIKKAKQKQ